MSQSPEEATPDFQTFVAAAPAAAAMSQSPEEATPDFQVVMEHGEEYAIMLSQSPEEATPDFQWLNGGSDENRS